MSVHALPAQGCSGDVLSPDRLTGVIGHLSDAQRTALLQVLASGESMTRVELYKGELGTGFCLPDVQKLLLLPAQLQKASDDLQRAITEAGF